MGGAASKAGRKLPKRKEAPSWGASPSAELQARDRRASESRTREIEKDAQDPHFLANLNRLGPVRVDHHMQAIHSTAETNQLFKSRIESEHEAASLSPIHNRLHAISLCELLDKRKSAKTVQDVELLSKQYDIDFDKLENLASYVNSPSVQPAAIQRTVERDGEETTTIQAIWVEPHLQK